MRKIWGYLENRAALATFAVLTVALLGMGLLLCSSTATAGYPAEDTRNFRGFTDGETLKENIDSIITNGSINEGCSSSSSSEDSVEIAGKIYCLKCGDLLFSKKEEVGKHGHVGIYSGNRKVIDAFPRTPGVAEIDIEGCTYFDDTDKLLGVKRVDTSQQKRDSAVAWARTKLGSDFEGQYESGAPTDPCEDEIWYCSELVHCAYKEYGIILGGQVPCPVPYCGYIPPIDPWPWAIWRDSAVSFVDPKQIGSVSSTDSSGSTKNCFTTTETVYAKGTGFCRNSNYNIYVCPHPVSNGASLSGCPYSSQVDTDSNGYFTPQPKSMGTLAEGDYDIVVDENGNGKYDSGIDAIDNSFAVHECCADDDCGADGWDCKSGTRIREYHDWYCSGGLCSDSITATENCDDHDGWYCVGDVRQYQYYSCSGGVCVFTVIGSEDCNTNDDWFFIGWTPEGLPKFEYRDYYCTGPGGHAYCDYRVTQTLIRLASFTAAGYDGHVLVEWETASEIDTEGFNVWRSQAEDGQYIKLNAAMIPPQGSPITGASYSYVDDTVINGVTYYYKLEDVDTYGTSTFHGPVSATPARVFRMFVPLVIKGP